MSFSFTIKTPNGMSFGSVVKLQMMRFSINPLLLALLAILLLLFVPHTTVRADESYVGHLCSVRSYSTNSTYESNLHSLMSDLTSRSTVSNGFSRVNSGQNQKDSVKGYALCRGDISESECSKCLNFASTNVLQLCPNQDGGVAWYDHCMLKYSPFSTPDTLDLHYMKYEIQDLVIDPSNLGAYFEARNGLLSFLVEKASIGNLSSKFAIGNINFTDSDKIYALLQCFESDCAMCLNLAVENMLLPVQKWRALKPNCDLRVAPTQFYHSNVNAPGPYSLPPVTRNDAIDTKGSTHQYLLAVILLIVCCIALMATLCIFLRVMRPKKKIQSINNPRSASGLQTIRVDNTGHQRPDQRGVGASNARPILEIPMLAGQSRSDFVSSNTQDETSHSWILKTPVDNPSPR